jgi:hypothetical protein
MDATIPLSARSLIAAMILALLAGCASPAPPASRHTPPLQTELEMPAEAAGPTVSLLCDPAVRKIAFPSMGIPLYTSLLDIALTPDRVWLLVDQHHIVEVGRSPDKPTFRTIVGKEDATWDALDVDPVDGSLWIVSLLRLELIHLIPDGKSTIVRIPRLEGEGGFRDVLVDEEAVYVVPTCATDALWKVARDGKLLGQAFRREGEEVPLTLREEFTPEEGQGSLVGCIPVSMARDLSGRVTVFDGPPVRSTVRKRASGSRSSRSRIRSCLPEGSGSTIRAPSRRSGPPSPAPPAMRPRSSSSGRSPSFSPRWIWKSRSRARCCSSTCAPRPEGMTAAFERCKALSWGGRAQIVSDQHGFVSAIDNQLILGTFGGTN